MNGIIATKREQITEFPEGCDNSLYEAFLMLSPDLARRLMTSLDSSMIGAIKESVRDKIEDMNRD